MFDTLTFPDTMEEFIERYKVIKGKENLYCEGVEFIPVFRMKEWVERLQPRKGEWIYCRETGYGNPYGHFECSLCGDGYGCKTNFCPTCGADMRNTIKPKSCFECKYSVDYSDDTVMCSEIKNMISISQNHDMIPPFCPKYMGVDMREGDSE